MQPESFSLRVSALKKPSGHPFRTAAARTCTASRAPRTASSSTPASPSPTRAAIAPYLAELGISDIYASPILKARKGSGHGYDVVDANALNPELGTDDDFNALHDELQRRDLGLLLDVVPNHMAASPENAWWMSVLENGEHSRFLHYFDIDWTPVTTRGQTVSKVLLPILGKPYGEALESQRDPAPLRRRRLLLHLLRQAPAARAGVVRPGAARMRRVAAARGRGHRVARAGRGRRRGAEQQVPEGNALADLRAGRAVPRRARRRRSSGINSDADFALDALLDAQWYRLAYWRIASEKINYRRFFDVTDLVGVRVENPEVFEARNRRTLELIAEGKVTGLRIDHIDGLYDPIGHMRKLQLRLAGEPSRRRSFLHRRRKNPRARRRAAARVSGQRHDRLRLPRLRQRALRRSATDCSSSIASIATSPA